MDRNNETNWWWLSFCDPERPEGKQFLGVAIVTAEVEDVFDALTYAGEREIGLAIRRTHDLGINPGGEVSGILIPPEHVPDERYRDRLLDRAELESSGLA